MISFADQAILWLLLPLALGLWSFGRVQKRALTWLETHVAPRFRRRFSAYDDIVLMRHLSILGVMATLLVFAAAGPSRQGTAEATAVEGRVLFLVDASASMFADDVTQVVAAQEPPATRLEVARRIALDLVSNLPGYRFALASYSGSGVVHLPMTANRPLLEDALQALESHNYYKNTGSDLAAALDVVSHFSDPQAGRLQVVMLGDGELPRDIPYDAALAALPPQGIVVHAVTIGSLEGQRRVIYDFRDVVAEKENPATLSKYTTRRVDRHFEKIASRTGGFFSVAEPGVSLTLAESLRTTAAEGHQVVHEAARKDLVPWLLALVLAGFLFDTLVFGQWRRPGSVFEIERLGKQPTSAARQAGRWSSTASLLVAAFLLASCGDSPRQLAHYENEDGIANDAFGRHAKARPHYEKSRGFGIEPHIPTHNLARSVALSGDVSEAHDLFQQALELQPDLPEAFFNDGVTLYAWGEAERDPENCDLERTRELWSQAAARFATTASLDTVDEELESQARENSYSLARSLAEIGRLIANPPEHCLSESEQEASGGVGGGDDEESQGGAGGQGEQGDQEEEGQGGGGEDEEEESEGGGGEDGQEEEPQGEGGGASGPQGESPENQSGGSSGGLTEEQVAKIRELIGQIAERGREGKRFHRKTGPEQFSREDWQNPDSELWW